MENKMLLVEVENICDELEQAVYAKDSKQFELLLRMLESLWRGYYEGYNVEFGNDSEEE